MRQVCIVAKRGVCHTKVVLVQDSKADNRQFDPAELERDERAYGGNYIIIDHLNGEYSWFGHIK